jgi:DNA-binding NtrC family response regulator
MVLGPPAAAKPRILIVDDDESVRLTAAALLEEHFEVGAVRSGGEALVWLRSHDVDVICTDLQMAGMNGFELLKQAMERYPHVSGILITGHRDFLVEAARAVDKLAYAVLLKPYSAHELIERVRRAAHLTGIKRSLGQRATHLGLGLEPQSESRTGAAQSAATALKRRS